MYSTNEKFIFLEMNPYVNNIYDRTICQTDSINLQSNGLLNQHMINHRQVSGAQIPFNKTKNQQPPEINLRPMMNLSDAKLIKAVCNLELSLQNIEQNISSHDQRITTNENNITEIKQDISSHDQRITTNENNITEIKQDISSHDQRIEDLEGLKVLL